jgi:hypothetical protein
MVFTSPDRWAGIVLSCLSCLSGEVQMNKQELSSHDEIVLVAKSRQAKKHVFCSAGIVAGTGCKTLACASEVMVQ